MWKCCPVFAIFLICFPNLACGKTTILQRKTSKTEGKNTGKLFPAK